MKVGNLLLYTALKGKKNFSRLFHDGTYHRVKGIALKAHKIPSNQEQLTSKWAICVPRKLGKSVLRNRYRRICKETLRNLDLNAKPGFFVALLPQNNFISLSPYKRKLSLLNLLGQAGMIASASPTTKTV